MKKRTKNLIKQSGRMVDPTLDDSLYASIYSATQSRTNNPVAGVKALAELFGIIPTPAQQVISQVQSKTRVIRRGGDGRNLIKGKKPILNEQLVPIEETYSVVNCAPGQMRDAKGRCGPAGSSNITREKMPQIKSDDLDEFLKYMKGKGVSTHLLEISAKSLKPIQKEFRQDRVDKLDERALKKSILISLDNRILDGTHRWLKRYQRNKNEDVPCIRLSVKHEEALELMKGFPQVKYVENVFCATGQGGGVDPSCKGSFSDGDFKHEEDVFGDVVTKKMHGGSLVFQMTNKGDVQLSSIRVPVSTRGKGTGKKIMKEFLDETDRRGLKVELIASPLDKRTNLGKLVGFYEKFGFKVVGRGNVASEPKMVREAKPVSNAFCATGKGGGVDPHCKVSGGIDKKDTPSNLPTGGQYDSIGYSKVVNETTSVVKKWGYSKDIVEVLNTYGKKFTAGGETWESLAQCNLNNGKIDIYAKSLLYKSKEVIRSIVAHEIMHGMFSRVMDRYVNQEDNKKIDDKMLAKGAKFKVGPNAYSTFDRLKKIVNTPDAVFEKDDGVSEYSKAYWKDYKKGKTTLHMAIHETLAEIASHHEKTGKIIGSPLYQEFYKTIRDEYKVLTGKKTKRSNIRPTTNSLVQEYTNHKLYLNEDFIPTTSENAIYLRWWNEDGKSGWAIKSDQVDNAFCATGQGGGIDSHCSPSSKGTGETQQTAQPSFFQRAIAGAKKAIAKFNTAYDKVMSLPVLRTIKRIGDFNKGLVKRYYSFLQSRYGKTQAMAIMASGQAVGWGAMAGPVMGLPSLYLPLVSVWGSLPAAAAAEGFLQIKRGVGAIKSKLSRGANLATNAEDRDTPILTQKEIDREARKMVKSITESYIQHLKDHVDDYGDSLRRGSKSYTENRGYGCISGSWDIDDSSCLSQAGYDCDEGTLSLLFVKGKQEYDYPDVSPLTLVELLNADSKGGFYHEEIRNEVVDNEHSDNDIVSFTEGYSDIIDALDRVLNEDIIDNDKGFFFTRGEDKIYAGEYVPGKHHTVSQVRGPKAAADVDLKAGVEGPKVGKKIESKGDKDSRAQGTGALASTYVATTKDTKGDQPKKPIAQSPITPQPTRVSMKDTASAIMQAKKDGKYTDEMGVDLLSRHTVDQLRTLRTKMEKEGYESPEKTNRLIAVVDKAISKVEAQTGAKKDETPRPESSTGERPGAGRGTDRGRFEQSGSRPTATGRRMEGEVKGPSAKTDAKGEESANKPNGGESSKSIPTEGQSSAKETVTAETGGRQRIALAKLETVNRRLDKLIETYRGRGQEDRANFMQSIKEHVNNVGTREALKSLGRQKAKGKIDVQYGGHEDISNFARDYLARNGISLMPQGGAKDLDKPLISSLAPSAEKVPYRGVKEDVLVKNPTLKDKLEEAKNLPGLSKSEDISKLVGKRVDRFTPDVVDKLDKTYGKGKWIVKSYGEEAYAGYGIFFPQRVEQIHKDAKSAIWDSGQNLGKYGFKHFRNKSGTIVGIEHEGGDKYIFGTDKYKNTIQGDARVWADSVYKNRIVSLPDGDKVDVGSPRNNEKATRLPKGSFMAQSAFPVVGISDAERAQGVTFKKGQEGRVHIVTRDGKVTLIPHSTWLKKEHFPVVFETKETRLMARAAVRAVKALPESERQGQLYAPDVVKTAKGFRVVEANPANEAGASGYLADNPYIIDSYVSKVMGRTPAHVRFIRRLLTSRAGKNTKTEEKPIGNVFCATGQGGGIDPTCGKEGGTVSISSSKGVNDVPIIASETNVESTTKPTTKGLAKAVVKATAEKMETSTKQEVGKDTTVGKFGPPKGNWKEPVGDGLPGEKDVLPPVKEFVAPPLPKGKAGSKAGGVSAVAGMTNTHIGDLVEHVIGKGGDFKSILPPGQRQNPLDVKYDDSKNGFEIKGVSTHATEYKSAPKSEEVEAKTEYAKQYGYKKNLIIAVIDPDNLTIHAYMREGEVVGSLYKGGRLNTKGFKFLGEHKFSEEDIEATRPAEKVIKKKGKKS